MQPEEDPAKHILNHADEVHRSSTTDSSSSSNELEDGRIEKIMIWTAKGGVSKTTTTQHLPFTMCEVTKKNVLIFDMDAQFDATYHLFFPELENAEKSVEQFLKEESHIYKNFKVAPQYSGVPADGEHMDKCVGFGTFMKDEERTSFDDNQQQYTIGGIMNGYFLSEIGSLSSLFCMEVGHVTTNEDGKTRIVHEVRNPHNMTEARDAYAKKKEKWSQESMQGRKSQADFHNTLPIPTKHLRDEPSVFLAAGCPLLDQLPGYLSRDTEASFQYARGVLKELVEKTAKRYECKYVFFDCNPSTLPREENVFNTADWLISPVHPDPRCARAIGRQAKKVTEWTQELILKRMALSLNVHQCRRKKYMPKDPSKEPTRYLGCIATNYNTGKSVSEPKIADMSSLNHIYKASESMNEMFKSEPKRRFQNDNGEWIADNSAEIEHKMAISDENFVGNGTSDDFKYIVPDNAEFCEKQKKSRLLGALPKMDGLLSKSRFVGNPLAMTDEYVDRHVTRYFTQASAEDKNEWRLNAHDKQQRKRLLEQSRNIAFNISKSIKRFRSGATIQDRGATLALASNSTANTIPGLKRATHDDDESAGSGGSSSSSVKLPARRKKRRLAIARIPKAPQGCVLKVQNWPGNQKTMGYHKEEQGGNFSLRLGVVTAASKDIRMKGYEPMPFNFQGKEIFVFPLQGKNNFLCTSRQDKDRCFIAATMACRHSVGLAPLSPGVSAEQYRP